MAKVDQRAHDGQWVSGEEHRRIVEELARANRRLSGTLQIILGTLDATDVGTLFSRVLEEITRTIEAFGTMVYLAEHDGYHLRGASSALEGLKLPRFVPFNRALESLAIRTGGALRLQLLSPQQDDLRRGSLTMRDVRDEASGETYRYESELMPPFQSFYLVPVWFGGQVVALLSVGWDRTHPLHADDAELLDAVARYLSVQLVGAFTALRTQRETQLKETATRIREHLLEQREIDQDALDEAFARAAVEMGCIAVPVVEKDGTPFVHLPLAGRRALPANLVVSDPVEEVSALRIEPDVPLGRWLKDQGEPARGALLDVDAPAGLRFSCLFLRKDEGEPLDELELAFLDDVGHDLLSVGRGDEARSQDKAISQALQTGMRNELQKVEGLTAEAVYSSATAAAFVGGDFYDLIRLPGQRACVLMGDVSGKGVEAASVSAAVKTALGAYAWEGLQPAHMVRLLNEFLLGFSRLETFATLFVGIVDLKRRLLTYCSAGHPPALLVRSRSHELESLGVQSGVVGAFSNMRYHDGRVKLEPGDVLVLYTDGTTEARSPEGDFFGEDGLRDALHAEMGKGFAQLPERLLQTLDDYTGRRLADDIAILALRLDG